ncbi:histidine kinase [Paenibacillus sp. KQZ6P-2]|uniref:Histidine kinase n=1 Tax=Paenibacillus mangrovi TaxID=2931978 RepID=A0A9X2B7B7_9BACL|nr:histidine kinase [Paenibacillus mangrovi]MCJ8013533.1 histidine kinase [Paenibacillus mangrovi]
MKWSSRRYGGPKSVQKRLLIMLMTVFIPISLLLYFVYSFAEQTLVSKVEEINRIRVEQTASRVQDLLQRIFMATNLFINDKQFIDALEIKEPHDITKNQIYLEAVERLQYAFFLNEKYTVVIQDRSGNEFVSETSRLQVKKQELLQFVHSKHDIIGTDIFHSSQWSIAEFSSEQRFIVFTRLLFKPDTATPKGIATIFIPISYIEQILLSDDTYYEIQDEEAKVLYSTPSSSERSKITRKGDQQISIQLQPADWSLVQLRGTNFLKKQLKWFDFAIYMTMGLIVIIFLINSALVIRTIRKVFYQVRSLSNQLIAHSPVLKISMDSDHHIVELSAVLRQLVHNLNASRENYKQASDEKRKLEMQMLQHQINPHFLLNSLNTIRFIADIRKQPKVSSLLLSLSYLLQQQLYNDGEYWTFREEKAYLEKYIEILRARFGESFQVYIDFEMELMERSLLRMLIQPLVENCFEHAFAGRKSGEIRIRAVRLSLDRLAITITDNGTGIVQTETSQTRKSIGIKNIRERIKLHYGDSAEFSIDSIPHIGVTVTMLIPYSSEVAA